ncbi:hypothetical protein ACXR0O_23485 [Verrucomicrobiota bacterium sgz303538]
MATNLVLSFKDCRPLGTFSEIETMLRTIFPEVTFGWRESGWEKLRQAEERGIKLPLVLRESLESLPALYEAVAMGRDYYIEFCLGPSEPVTELVVEPRGAHPELEEWLSALESRIGTSLRINGSPALD